MRNLKFPVNTVFFSTILFVWSFFSVSAQNVGIGTSEPRGFLEINGNSTTGNIKGAQLLLHENKNDFARLRMTNSLYNDATNNKFWDIAARINTGAPGNFDRINFYLESAGDIMTINGLGNVGIGTTEPAARLHLNTASQVPLILQGGNSLYVPISEGNQYRGYIGSFAGNPEDVDFGTGAGNSSGKVHLTVQAVPALTVNNIGNVGIGTTNPTFPLDVIGGIRFTGRLFVNGTSGTGGQVLTSGGGVNNASWQTLSSAYDNNIRFAVHFSTSSSSTTRTILYNTNNTAVSLPTSGTVTINTPGLYHFEGNYSLRLVYANQTAANNVGANFNFFVGTDDYEIAYANENDFKRTTTGSSWMGRVNVVWQKDVYISTTPATVSFGYSFSYAPTNSATLTSRTLVGKLSGYMINP